MEQLIAHMIGDYVIQSDWMANNKTKPGLFGLSVAFYHAATYTIPFIFIIQNPISLAIIMVSHGLIDHFRLAAKYTQLRNWNWQTSNGFPADRPVWLTTWVVILVDNTFHLLINYCAIAYASNRLL